ncbi:N-acetylmuramoyl-L-alanine amidase domain-containing protein [Aspergillus karnatakaensis]|uniref:N-acetylmuramoyl-L-alanine amidase domain-containing protein n=1 Tax=Aspergillus karnatakaensis TaxID=1810916 RepID=UPI003CCD9CE5
MVPNPFTSIGLALLSLTPTATAMFWVDRAGWNAQPPKADSPSVSDVQGVKVHWVGEAFESREHSACAAYMRSTQELHLNHPTENYNDIAYSLAVCEHGYVYEGRGEGVQNGANGGQTLNANHYAVLAFLGETGLSEPTDNQILGIQDAIAYLQRAGAGTEILGHKDGYGQTECPGPALDALVDNGGLDPGELNDATEHTVQDGEDLADIAEQYNIPERYIIAANDLGSAGNITAGDVLEIPARGVPIGGTPPDDGGDGGDGDDGGDDGGGDGGDDGGDDGDGDDGDDGDDGGGTTNVPFPGAAWFKSQPNSPVITAMGKRLVAEGCSEYSVGPGPQWTTADKNSYSCWQRKLGYTGADADGWPGQASWDKLKVPPAGNSYESFPGASWFKNQPNSPIITAMGSRLVVEGCSEYSIGPGPQWTNADKNSYSCWQKKLGYTGVDADGWPGQTSWNQLKVPNS